MTLKEIIHSDPEILGGTPIFAGTRVPVRILLDYLEGGEPLGEFLENYPSVSREQAVAFLEEAAVTPLQMDNELATCSVTSPSSQVDANNRIRLMDQLTDSMVAAIDFDSDIINDHIKYSSWLAAIALGGVAAVATHFYELVAHSYLRPGIARLTIVFGIAILFGSIGVAAFLTWKSNQQLSTARKQKTLYLNI